MNTAVIRTSVSVYEAAVIVPLIRYFIIPLLSPYFPYYRPWPWHSLIPDPEQTAGSDWLDPDNPAVMGARRCMYEQ